MSLHEEFRSLEPLRLRPSWRILRGIDVRDGRAKVVIVASSEVNETHARARLDAFESAHARIDDPHVPRVERRLVLDGREVAVLDCDVVADGITIRRMLTESNVLFPYAAADGFISTLRKSLQSAHRVRVSGEPICIGRFSAANLLFDRRGRPFLVGFGANVPIEDAAGEPDPNMPYFQAPELGSGGAPSPMGDYVALLSFARSIVLHVDMGVVGRLLRGGILPTDGPLIDALRWVEQRVVGEIPALRPTMDEAIANADRIRKLLRVTPDAVAHAAVVARLLERDAFPDASEVDTAHSARSPRLVLGPEARWFTLDGSEPRDLGTSGRRVLEALCDRHLLGLREPMRTVDLVEAGWPGESPVHEAGTNRVYVTMSRLRKAGLEQVIERFDDGYRLLPEVRVSRAREA